MVAVVNEAAADQVRAAGAVPQLVTRSQGELDRLFAQVDKIARTQRGLQSWGIDPIANKVVVKARGGYGAFAGLGDGVQVVRVTTDFRQQAGEVNPGDPWWPGGESNCSVGFPATDAQQALPDRRLTGLTADTSFSFTVVAKDAQATNLIRVRR